MDCQQTNQNETAETVMSAPTAAGSCTAGGQEADVCGDAQAMAQAARAVMHPDRYDLEWRFYHGAVHG
jgi:hypothetical protein